MTYVARRPRSFLSIGMLEAFAATARHGRSLAPRRANIGVYLVA
jgi:hypothetical protein